MRRKNMMKNGKFLKKSLVSALSLALVATSIPSVNTYSYAKTDTESGEKAVVIAGKDTTNIKNVIYMIPDGGGFPTYDIAKAVKSAGQDKLSYKTATTWTSKNMYLDDYLEGCYYTSSADNEVTDSAAGGTALACGKKTNNGTVGLDEDGKPIANLLEMSRLQGKATGIVATSYSSDATPAAFSAHAFERTETKDVITQMFAGEVNLVLCGCLSKRCGLSSKSLASENNYKYVTNTSGLTARNSDTFKDASSELKLWGDFDRGNEYQIAYDNVNDKKVPTLKQMTDTSLKLLSQDEDGFFLMVEGSKIDYSNHRGDMVDSSTEWIAFDEAFKVALDFASNRTDTVVVVAPDHNTGVAKTPSSSKMTKVVSMVQKKKDTSESTDLLTFTAKGHSYSHSSHLVGLWMYLPSGTPKFEDVITVKHTDGERGNYTTENTEVAKYVAKLIADDTVGSLKDATNLLFHDVTKMGTYSNGKFKFKDYNASVQADSDIVTVNGEEQSTNGEYSLYVNNKMYISQKAYEMVTGERLGSEVKFEGKGTKSEPYEISSADNFNALMESVKAGETYTGKYFVQTGNVDLTKVDEFKGSNGKGTFAGYYNGQGHTINVGLAASEEELSVFPTVAGSIYNLGVTGTITNTNGNCAGIANEVSASGKLYQCFSSVTLNAKNIVAGIVGTVADDGVVNGCYYTGVAVGAKNMGIANGTVTKCYYQMKNGSTSVSSSGSGSSSSNLKAEKLNGKKAAVAKTIGVEKDALCDFVDVENVDIAFVAGVSYLTNFTYTYTCKNGKEKTVNVSNFDATCSGYNENILDDEMNANLPIKLQGTAMYTGGSSVIEEKMVSLDSKGFASASVEVSTTFSNDFYKTNSSKRYNINFTGPIPEHETATPAVTATPNVTATPAVSNNKLTVYYQRSANTSWSKAYVHYKVDGVWTKSPGVGMNKISAGYWYTTIDMKNSSEATLIFNDGNGNWDNNSSKKYTLNAGTYLVNQKEKTISTLGTAATVAPTATPAATVAPTATPVVTVAPTATATVVPTATPTVAPTATPTVAPTATPTVAPTETPVSNKVVVYYKRSANTSWSKAYVHYKVNGVWTKSPGVKMEKISAGYWKVTIDLGETTDAILCFNNGSGSWDTNSNKKYEVKAGEYLVNLVDKTVTKQ